MFIRKKIRSKILIVVIIVLAFLYWRGVKTVAAKKGWNCNYHVAYAICDAKNNKAQLPGIWDILKAGASF